jgi:hypothetical protein
MGRGTDVYKLSLHNLRQLCCRAGRIPKACHIPGTIVLEVPHPVSQGGYSDVYRGTYGGCPVAVKALRVHLSERDKLMKVRYLFWFHIFAHTLHRRSARRSYAGNSSYIPTSFHFGASRTCFLSVWSALGWRTDASTLISNGILRETERHG